MNANIDGELSLRDDRQVLPPLPSEPPRLSMHYAYITALASDVSCGAVSDTAHILHSKPERLRSHMQQCHEHRPRVSATARKSWLGGYLRVFPVSRSSTA